MGSSVKPTLPAHTRQFAKHRKLPPLLQASTRIFLLMTFGEEQHEMPRGCHQLVRRVLKAPVNCWGTSTEPCSLV
jgi:hypothetical protein